MRKLFVWSLAVAGCVASAQISVYNADFQTSAGSEWSNTSRINVQTSTNRWGLGPFSNDAVTLSLAGLTSGQAYKLKFDLYLLNSWDGNTPSNPGPDYFRTRIDGTAVLNATFAVVSGWTQSYSAATPLGGPTVAGLTNADEGGTLDYNFYGSGVYKFGGPTNPGFDFVASGTTASITFDGYGLQGWSDEGWAIDNVDVSTTVPEPASLFALAAGVFLLRRRVR